MLEYEFCLMLTDEVINAQFRLSHLPSFKLKK